jgi:hypothetical protein
LEYKFELEKVSMLLQGFEPNAIADSIKDYPVKLTIENKN